MTTTDAITARFNGHDVTFRIPRDYLPHFEAAHGSAYALYRKIVAGAWSVAEIAAVLRFASGELLPTKSEAPEHFAMRARLGEAARGEKGGDAVASAFAARGPATYAPLAAAVLMAALMGVDEAEARFSDEDNGNE